MVFRSLSNSRGQVAVLFALIFPLFVLLLAFFVNMGLLINQKIRLQNSVDAGVYSANASLAADLNRIASRNRDILRTFDGSPSENKHCRQWRGGKNYLQWTKKHNFNDKLEAQAKYWEYQNAYHDCLDKIDRINNNAVREAIGKGENAALRTFYNGDTALVNRNPNGLKFTNLKPSGKMMNYIQNSISTTSCYERVMDSGGNPFDPYEGYACDFTKEASLPISKAITSQVTFGAKLEADVGFRNILPSRFRVADEHYDPATGRIKLTATAAGQPYSGSIKGLRDTYRATLIPLKKFDGSRDELH